MRDLARFLLRESNAGLRRVAVRHVAGLFKALEDNATICHTINGRRTERKRTNTKVAANAWHTLHVDFQGTRFTVAFDGKTAIEWDDATYKEAGNVDVWTKADSVQLPAEVGRAGAAKCQGY